MNQPAIEVLLVEDNLGDAFLIQDSFKHAKGAEFKLSHVERLEQAIALLSQKPFDAILLDLFLPDSQALDTLLTLQKKVPSLPIVILTGMNDEEKAIEAVREGAQDYLVKGQTVEFVLFKSIRYAIERKGMQEQLQKRTAELETLNNELEAFSYTVCHDLRRPLTHIKCFLSLLQEVYADRLDEQGKDYIKGMDKSCWRMKQIIEDLIMLSQVKRNEMRIESVDLSAMVQDIASQLEENQRERQVEFIVHPRVIVQGDKHLLSIALENLLNNAWKYTAKEENSRIEFGAIDNESVYFVSDNGVGFDMQYAEGVFTPFGRLHNQREFEGTGIGLATVRRIIERHGGRIWCNARVNRGAVFYFTIDPPFTNTPRVRRSGEEMDCEAIALN